MKRAKRKWKRSAGLGLALAMAMAVAGCWGSDSEPSLVNDQTTVPNANYKMNVTFYADDEEGNATDVVISSGTFAFDKASFELDEFEAQWRLRVPRSAKRGPLAESRCLELLAGPGVMEAARVDGGWWLNLQPHMADCNIYVLLESFSEESWSGQWNHGTIGGAPRMGTFEAVKAGG